MREVWLNQKKQAQTSAQMDQMQTTTKMKLLRNKNDLRLTVSAAHQIPNNDPHHIYCENCHWVCNFLNVWSLCAGEPLISHWHHHILYQASLSVLQMNPFLLYLS